MKLPALALAALAAAGQTTSTGPRITPPTLTKVDPLGAARGTTVELSAEGLNLAGATAVHFSRPGITGKIVRVKELPDLPDIRLGSNGTPSTIDLGPLPPRNQVAMEVEIAPEAAVGPVDFRIVTPLGTSPVGRFLVEPYFGEAPDKEPNDTPETAFDAFLPAVLAGAITRPGDVDHFKIHAEAGEEIVFEDQARLLGSSLQPVVAILDGSGAVLHEAGYASAADARRFSYRFANAGDYWVRIADYEKTGRASHTYRFLAGRLTLLTGVYPLGVRRGGGIVQLSGFNLGEMKVAVEPQGDAGAVKLRPSTPGGSTFNEVTLAVGDDPEVASQAALGRESAQALALPVTVNGRLAKAASHWYRFEARAGERIVLEVEARRFGSHLDSIIDVFDSKGKPVERGVARAVWETSLVLRDHDSVQRGLRLQGWNALETGDYILAGNEICRIAEVPDGPDEDTLVESFGGQRVSWFGTSGEAHGIDQPVYKVRMHPAGAAFSPNGLPQKRLYYSNDDGGPGYGKDSYLEFAAPADGSYFARVADVRGLGGDGFAYRLHAREPRPDFRLTANPRNLNVPRGGVIPVTITADRREGYEGPIEVGVDGTLPAGVTATTNTIPAGQVSATILVSAAANAELADAARFAVAGTARIGETTVKRRVNTIAGESDTLQLIALAPPADVELHAVTKVVEIEPGQTGEITLRLRRRNGFAGRVPIQVADLPDRVRVADSGLNGVMVNEDETERSFRILALPNAAPVEGRVYVSGVVETRSGQQNSQTAPESIVVRVKSAAKKTAAVR
ncbi:MAG: hypothetical protein R2729_10640 [Bryobacteraceae bacterium]